jgi:hypothetical protein
MPAVPTAPSGTLTNRDGGAQVSDSLSKLKFFDAFKEEFLNHRNIRSFESKETLEDLQHGDSSGYMIQKEECKEQGAYNSSTGNHYLGTRTTEYNDYSNKGRLYFGGGWAKAQRGFRNSSTSTDTTIINGKVKFNGEFKGELDFQNFKFEYSNIGYKHISGKVMIGTLDVTQEYVKYVLKRERVVLPLPAEEKEIDPAIIGSWINQEGEDPRVVYNFKSDGTFDYYSSSGQDEKFYSNPSNPGKWFTQNDTLVMVIGGHKDTTKYSISGSTLYFQGWWVLTKYTDELPK